MALDKRTLKENQQNKISALKIFFLNLFTVTAICVLGIIIYSNSFFSPFHFDDDHYIVNNFSIRNINNLMAIWNCFPTRFITFLTFAFNYHLNKLNVFGFHVFNMAIHLGTASLVWWLTTLIFSTPTIKKNKVSSISKSVALFTALIFLSHPLQTESVTYLWQRSTSLAGFFYLFSLCLYLKSRLLQIEGKSILKWIGFYALSWIFALVSMFTKENSATLPLIIILLEFYFIKINKHINWKYAIPFLFLLPIIPGLLFFTKPDTFSDLQRLVQAPNNAGGHYLATQLRVIITYIRLLFLPLNQNLDYDYPVIGSIFRLPAILSLLLLTSILFIAFRLSQKHKLISFGIFWFFITLLPESSIIPLKDVIFEHRLYLPMVGFSIFLVSSGYYLFQQKRSKLIIIMFSFLVIGCSILTYARNKVWTDGLVLWTDTINKSPNKARPYNNRGLVYHTRNKPDEALSDYGKAIELDPKFTEPYINAGLVYKTKNELDRALYYFTKAIELDPHYAKAYNNRGAVYYKKNDLSEALYDYSKAIELNPTLAEAYNNAGLVYLAKNELDQALYYFNKATEIDPSYAKAYNSRGVVYHNKGEFEKALSDYNKALEIDPKTVGAYSNRESLYREMK